MEGIVPSKILPLHIKHMNASSDLAFKTTLARNGGNGCPTNPTSDLNLGMEGTALGPDGLGRSSL
jgi:hypothetical protein